MQQEIKSFLCKMQQGILISPLLNAAKRFDFLLHGPDESFDLLLLNDVGRFLLNTIYST
jgi:hypothetical protein